MTSASGRGEPPPTEQVRAAGGLVLRGSRRAGLEVAVIHRPGRDDWSFPKGKLDRGESASACALREVHEETGLRCRLLEPFGTTRYQDRRGRDKVVDYWLMEPVSGAFVASEEVDAFGWFPVPAAVAVVTYDRDRELLERLLVPRLSLSV